MFVVGFNACVQLTNNRKHYFIGGVDVDRKLYLFYIIDNEYFRGE